MDSLTLRIILLALGVFFIVGIYLWDRRNHVDARLFNRRKARKSLNKNRERHRNSSAFEHDSEVDGLPSMQINADDDDVLVEEPKAEPVLHASRTEKINVQEEEDLPSFSARSAFDEYMAGADLPGKILQIHLLCKGNKITGQMVLDMAAELNLQYGEYNIFHRMDKKSGKSIFSMASVVEPGSFDLNKMDEFATPGLALFSQLPAPVDAMDVYNAMLEVGQRMAFIVGGELQDATHSALTRQSIEHEKSQIVAYQVKLDKAMQALA
jgi:cell division protein ZipA